MRSLLLLSVAATAVLLGPLACTSTYHPEYHPVTMSNVQQTVSYPVTVQTGTQPAPVVIAPAPAPAAPQDPAEPWASWRR
jgi:hypothetical protein